MVWACIKTVLHFGGSSNIVFLYPERQNGWAQICLPYPSEMIFLCLWFSFPPLSHLHKLCSMYLKITGFNLIYQANYITMKACLCPNLRRNRGHKETRVRSISLLLSKKHRGLNSPYEQFQSVCKLNCVRKPNCVNNSLHAWVLPDIFFFSCTEYSQYFISIFIQGLDPQFCSVNGGRLWYGWNGVIGPSLVFLFQGCWGFSRP